MKIIGLAGPRGCGKTTAARLLEQEAGFVWIAFADPIRQSVLGLYREWCSGHFEPPYKDVPCSRYGVSPRDVLRAFGEHARALDPLIYVHHMHGRLHSLELDRTRRVVIHDVRLPAEAALIRERGGHVVHVRRPGYEWTGEHVTEEGPGVELGDLNLPNPGSLETYRTTCRALLATVQGAGYV